MGSSGIKTKYMVLNGSLVVPSNSTQNGFQAMLAYSVHKVLKQQKRKTVVGGKTKHRARDVWPR